MPLEVRRQMNGGVRRQRTEKWKRVFTFTKMHGSATNTFQISDLLKKFEIFYPNLMSYNSIGKKIYCTFKFSKG